MSEYLPKEVREGLELARKRALRKKSRLRIQVGDDVFAVLKLWDDGFTLDGEDAPQLRGLVDLFDGAHHLYQCLVIASQEENGQMCYEFKRSTEVKQKAPLDFVRSEHAPAALIEKSA